MLTVVCHVVLVSKVVVTEVTLSELIYVQPVVATKQVLNLAIVLCAVNTCTNTCCKLRATTEYMVKLSSEVVVELVGVTLLNHGVCTVAIAITWINIATLVITDKAIEVDITCPVLHKLMIFEFIGLEVCLSKLRIIIVVLSKLI